MHFQVFVLSICAPFASRVQSLRLSNRYSIVEEATHCISPRCHKEPSVDAADEAHLCFMAFDHARRSTTEWHDLVRSTTIAGCHAPVDLGAAQRKLDRLMFSSDGCAQTDLCSIASAKLDAYSMVCHASSFRFCRDVLVARDIISLPRSLHCPCLTLDDGGGRSGAVLQVTHDKKYIVKGIKSDEMPVLMDMYTDFEGQVLLNAWSYIDPTRTLVIMPNSHDVSVHGLHAAMGVTYASDPQCQKLRGGVVRASFSDGWDVKPLPIKSPHRKRMLATLVEKRWRPNHMLGWAKLTKQMKRNIGFLSQNDLIDYSLLFSLFVTPAPERIPGCNLYTELSSDAPSRCLITPSCNAGERAEPIPIASASARPRRNYSDRIIIGAPPTDSTVPIWQSSSFIEQSLIGTECQALCVTIIDYLMVFSTKRWFENEFKGQRWTGYAQKVLKLWRCLGDLKAPDCEEYLQLGCQELHEQGKSSSWCSELKSQNDHIVDDADLDALFIANSSEEFDYEEFDDLDDELLFEMEE